VVRFGTDVAVAVVIVACQKIVGPLSGPLAIVYRS
jgi:hypothetical protein